MKPNTAVRDAVRAALAAGAIAAAGGYAPVGMAQEGASEDPADLGTVVTTGSRIKRLDLETAKPVLVITREDIERSGQTTVSDVLRQSPVNTFGSEREVSGSSFIGQALVDLRGLGTTRTLVLLNGRRLPRSPVTADQAIDLNTIPLEAVERVEVLQESASAVYGSDAIGGVINVILRDDYEGVQLMTGMTRPSQEGADEEFGSLLVGTASGKGSILFSAELFNKDIIFSRDRPFTATNRGDGVNFGTTEGISLAGNTALDFTTFDLLADPNCDNVTDAGGNQLYTGIFNDPSYTPISQACTYGYADISAESQSIKRQSAFLTADYEIAPDLTLTYSTAFTSSEFFGRYAPAVAISEFQFGNLFGQPALPAGAPASWIAATDEPGEGVWILHRFAALGPRDDTTSIEQFYNSLTLNGVVDIAGRQVDWEFGLWNTIYDSKQVGRNYIDRGQAINLTAQGVYQPWDPFSPSSVGALSAMAITIGRDVRAELLAGTGVVNFDLGELPSGPISWAVGFDYIDEHMEDLYDQASEGGNVIGSAGNSTRGARASGAVFFEAQIPVLDKLEVNVAGRYDRYNDVGNEFSPSISLRYRPTDWALIRGSWSEGFRAPNMTNLYSAIAFSADPIQDIARCRELGIPDSACPDTQTNVFSGGNPGLEPEQSESTSLGVVFDVGNFNASLDYWNVDIEKGLAIFTAQGLVNLQAEGRGLPAGTRITRGTVAGGGLGPLLRIDTGWANLAVLEVTGFDINVGYKWDTPRFGTFDLNLVSTYVQEYLEQSNPLALLEDTVGTDGQPQYQAQFVAQWSLGNYNVTFITRHIDEYDSESTGQRIPTWTTNDIQFNYNFAWDGELSIGVQNIGDNDPPLDPGNDTNQPFDSNLYDMDGRVPYISYRQRF